MSGCDGRVFRDAPAGCVRIAAAVLAVVTFLAARPSGAECASATECYCILSPGDGKCALVEAEVVSTEPLVTLRVIGDPYRDPGGLLQDGVLIEELAPNDSMFDADLAASQRGLFNVDLDIMSVLSYRLEEGGLISCPFADNFPGATPARVAAAALSFNCPNAVYLLGVREGECNDTISSCGCSGSSGTGSLSGLLLVALFTLRRKRR